MPLFGKHKQPELSVAGWASIQRVLRVAKPSPEPTGVAFNIQYSHVPAMDGGSGDPYTGVAARAARVRRGGGMTGGRYDAGSTPQSRMVAAYPRLGACSRIGSVSKSRAMRSNTLPEGIWAKEAGEGQQP